LVQIIGRHWVIRLGGTGKSKVLPHPLPVGISLSIESKLRKQSIERETDIGRFGGLYLNVD